MLILSLNKPFMTPRSTAVRTGLGPLAATILAAGILSGCGAIGGSVGGDTPASVETGAAAEASDDGDRLAQSRQLESGEIMAVVVNNTLSHSRFDEYFAADGTVSGRTDTGQTYSGTWTIDDDDNVVCTALPDFGAEGCAEVYSTEENELLFVTPDGRQTVLTISEGDQVSGAG